MRNIYQTYQKSADKHVFDRQMTLFADLARTVTHSDEASVLLLDQASDVLRFVATMSRDGEETKLVGHTVPMGEGITGLAAKSGDLQIGAPTYEDPDLSRASGDVRYVAAAPIVGRHGLLGAATLIAYDREAGYTADDGRHLLAAAEAAALAVDRMIDAQADAAGTELSGRSLEMLNRLSQSLSTLPQEEPAIAMATETLLQQLDTLLRAATGKAPDPGL